MAKRLTRTNIEYGDYNWSLYPGCLHGPQGICPVTKCWAEAMAKRHDGVIEKAQGLPKGSVDSFHFPHLVPELLVAPLSIRNPSIILVNFMGDLGGGWVEPKMDVLSVRRPDGLGGKTLRDVMCNVIANRKDHTYLFLTKNPSSWQKWGTWPDNAFVGFTACNQPMFLAGVEAMSKVTAKHKWVSFEPLLDWIPLRERTLEALFRESGISWVVIGGQTRPTIMPEISWVKEITEACDQAGVKVWEKNSLSALLGSNLRQQPCI